MVVLVETRRWIYLMSYICTDRLNTSAPLCSPPLLVPCNKCCRNDLNMLLMRHTSSSQHVITLSLVTSHPHPPPHRESSGHFRAQIHNKNTRLQNIFSSCHPPNISGHRASLHGSCILLPASCNQPIFQYLRLSKLLSIPNIPRILKLPTLNSFISQESFLHPLYLNISLWNVNIKQINYNQKRDRRLF